MQALNLLNAGYKMVVWNRDPTKCTPLIEAGAEVAESPAEVARQSDVVFGMLADPFAAFSVACRDQGIAEGMSPGKGYVDGEKCLPCHIRLMPPILYCGIFLLSASVFELTLELSPFTCIPDT